MNNKKRHSKSCTVYATKKSANLITRELQKQWDTTQAVLLTRTSTENAQPSQFPNGRFTPKSDSYVPTAAVPFGTLTRLPILRRSPHERQSVGT